MVEEDIDVFSHGSQVDVKTAKNQQINKYTKYPEN